MLKSLYSPLAAGLAVCLVLLGVTAVVDSVETSRFESASRTRVASEMGAVQARLEAALSSRLYLAQGLAAYVKTNPEVTQDQFDVFAEQLVSSLRGVKALQLAENSVISHVYPLAGNEAVVGLDLMGGLPEDQREALLRAMHLGETVVAGPVNLIQGGTGLVSRTPVFTGRGEARRYWGMATVIIDMDALYAESGLHDADLDLDFAIRGRDGLGSRGDIFYGADSVFGADPVTSLVIVPNGYWELAAIPAEGWLASPWSLPVRLGGVLAALIAGGMVWLLLLQVRERVRARKQYRDLVQNVRGVILRLRPDGTISFANDYALEFFGFTRAELVGHHVMETILPPEVLEGGLPLDSMLEDPESFSAKENLNQRKDGKTVWMSWANRAIRDRSGKLTEIVCVGTDISDRKLAEALREDVERMARHDLKAPLSAIMGLPGIIKEDGGLGPDQIRALELIENAGESMLAVIDTSIGLYRMEKGDWVKPATMVDLGRTLGRVAEENQTLAETFKVRLELDMVDRQCLVPGDKTLLYAMASNLVKNALEASGEGGVVTASLAVEGSLAVLSVHNGTPVPRDMRGRFFEKYATSGKSGGLGLGTYSVRLVAKAHGGNAEMTTSEDTGTTVAVSLPL